MIGEKELLLSLLRLTQNGPVRKEMIAKVAKVPAQTADQALRKLSQRGLIREYEGVIEATPSQRIKMVLYALRLAVDFEKMCRLLSWIEFESIAAEAFEANNYRVIRNFRFKQDSKRWEIDVIGLKKPLILCVDCKHWKRGWQKTAILKAVEAQTERTEAFCRALPNYHLKALKPSLEGWESATLIPIVMSLIRGPTRFCNNVPVVPVLQLQDFINGLPAEAHLLKRFNQKDVRLNGNLRRFS